ncbi:MAG: heavy-metal-associated domain-containing protein [Bdellovibrionales bacterium]
MKKIILIIFIFMSMSGQLAIAEKKSISMKHQKDHTHKASIKKNEEDKITIKVKGMVCAFCAQGIEKNFNKRAEVKNTKVNLDKMEVYIELNKGKSLSESILEEIVTSAGFSFEGKLP